MHGRKTRTHTQNGENVYSMSIHESIFAIDFVLIRHVRVRSIILLRRDPKHLARVLETSMEHKINVRSATVTQVGAVSNKIS